MQETSEVRDRMIREFTENYMEKLFYFCLRKTGSNTEAEDLTQDIALNFAASRSIRKFPPKGRYVPDRARLRQYFQSTRSCAGAGHCKRIPCL